MIAYKWVIEKNNKYYPLVNFGINTWMRNINCPPYELNHTYNYNGEMANNITEIKKKYNPNESDGFHFWKSIKNKRLIRKNWNLYLTRHNQPLINAVLKCEISSIINQSKCWNEERLIANKFKVLKIYKIKK